MVYGTALAPQRPQLADIKHAFMRLMFSLFAPPNSPMFRAYLDSQRIQ